MPGFFRVFAVALVAFCLLIPTRATAQAVVRGTVIDASTGETLPSATVQVDETTTGTITNEDGRFTLRVASLPVTLRARFIGYQTTAVRVQPGEELSVSIALPPSTVDMQELVVTAENTAENIMRRVIREKQRWSDSLQTYAVTAYNRFTLARDTGIVSIAESRTRAFYDRERGFREVVLDQRQTANLQELDALPSASAVVNLYADDVEFMGHRLRGVTHPNALDRYDFTIDSVRVLDGQRVFDIRVEPTSRLASAFRGRVSVLDSVYALVEARLSPSDAFVFPEPLAIRNVTFEQQFSSFGTPVWLPADLRMEMTIDVSLSRLLRLPAAQLRQVSRLSDYALNVSVPDSLFEEDRERVADVDPAALDSSLRPMETDTLGADGGAVPLTEAETRAYAQIDSTQTLDRAFQPEGPLARLLDLGASVEEEPVGSDTTASATGRLDAEEGLEVSWSALPIVRFNRVEEGHLGGRASVTVGGRVRLQGRGGWNSGPDGPRAWTYGGEATIALGSDRDVRVRASAMYGIEPRFSLAPYGQILNSLWAMAGEADVYDYMGVDRRRGEATFDVQDVDVRVRVQQEAQAPVLAATAYDVFGRDRRFRGNPRVAEQTIRSASIRAVWGDERLPVAFAGTNRLALSVEHANDALVPTDASFTRLHGSVDLRIPTFFQRRILGNTLDVRVEAGGALGDLPVSRAFAVAPALLPYTPFGALRVRDSVPLQGESLTAVHWEHHFRTVPFELLGLRRLVDAGWGVLLHGGHARTWVRDATQTRWARQGDAVLPISGWHHELGLSLNGLVDLFRLDLTARLDAPGYTVGLSTAKLF